MQIGVSIIIPVFNKIETTVECLKSIREHNKNSAFEIIIVDNGSRDETQQFLSDTTSIFYIRNEENLGVAKAFNIGAGSARYEVLCFMHNDVFIFQQDWTAAIHDFIMETPNSGVIGFYGAKTIRKDGSFRGKTIVHSKKVSPTITNLFEKVAVVDGLLIAIKKSVFDEIGEFNEEFPIHYYDKDISMRSIKSGYDNYVLSIPFEHLCASTRGDVKGEETVREEAEKRFIRLWKGYLPADVCTWKERLSLVFKKRRDKNMQLDTKKYNILHVVSRLPIGGVENMLLKVVNGYDKNRFNVAVCCLKEGGAIADELRMSGCKVEILNMMRGHGFDIGTVTALIKVMKRENIHILRTHQYHANLYGRIAGILAGVPVRVPSFHNLYESPNKPKLHRRFLNYLLGFFSDKLVAVSNAVASDMVKYDRINPIKMKVIYNGIAIDEFNEDIPKQEAKKRLNLPSALLIIGAAGRLTEQKGHKFLIEAASGFENICVVIAGDGPYKGKLENLAERLKVNCIFMGQLSPEKIPLFLKSLDIFCFPSLWEGFPVTLVEAMAAGLPITASDIPPHREVLGDAAILNPPRHTGELARALKMLIDNHPLRDAIAQKAKERARLFSIENTVKAYEELFENILKKKGLL